MRKLTSSTPKTTYKVYFGSKFLGKVSAFHYSKAVNKAREQFGQHVSLEKS